jgi:hypothetical protein
MGREQAVEQKWQEENIRPVVHKIFGQFGESLEIPAA